MPTQALSLSPAQWKTTISSGMVTCPDKRFSFAAAGTMCHMASVRETEWQIARCGLQKISLKFRQIQLAPASCCLPFSSSTWDMGARLEGGQPFCDYKVRSKDG